MSCYLQKDSASAEFVFSHTLRRALMFLSKKKMRQKLLTLLISLFFFQPVPRFVQESVQEILGGIFLYMSYYYRL